MGEPAGECRREAVTAAGAAREVTEEAVPGWGPLRGCGRVRNGSLNRHTCKGIEGSNLSPTPHQRAGPRR